MEKFKQNTVVIQNAKYEVIGGREFDEEMEEFEVKILEKFISALQDIDNLTYPMNDSFLMRFLRTKKYNVAAAVQVMVKYFELRRKNNDMVQIPFTTVQKVLGSQFLAVLKNREQNGCFVAWFRIMKWNPKIFNLDEIMISIYYLAEEATTRKEIQKDGIAVIFDCTGLTISQTADIAKELSIKQLKKIIAFYQGAFPAKIKKIFGIHIPLVFTALYAVVKYLLKAKLRNRIRLNTGGPETLEGHFDPNTLPIDLGGTLTYEEATDTTMMEETLKNEPYIQAIQKFGYPKT